MKDPRCMKYCLTASMNCVTKKEIIIKLLSLLKHYLFKTRVNWIMVSSVGCGWIAKWIILYLWILLDSTPTISEWNSSFLPLLIKDAAALKIQGRVVRAFDGLDSRQPLITVFLLVSCRQKKHVKWFLRIKECTRIYRRWQFYEYPDPSRCQLFIATMTKHVLGCTVDTYLPNSPHRNFRNWLSQKVKFGLLFIHRNQIV